VDSVEQMGRVRVADNGIGIASDMLPSVFQMFAQADRSLDRSQGGLGIGLSLVQSLLTLHNGAVSVRSEGPNRGSEFTVTLPMMGCEDETTDATTLSAASMSGAARKAHVLLVEDNDDNREVLQELLELEGYRVDVARDGTVGVQKALALKPDVAIVDIGLPGISGYEVARQLRHALGAHIALIALTGYGQPEDRQRTMDAGFDAHLTKPVGYPELEAMLRGRAGPS
jgi:CheY-like chemotaxis protein